MSSIALLRRGPSALYPAFQSMHILSKKRLPTWPNQQKQRLQKMDLAVGMIIRAPVHEEDGTEGGKAIDLPPPAGDSHQSHASNQSKMDRYTSQWSFGHISTKVRIFIVVALLNRHYLAVPLYTHNGTGIGKKKNPTEYIYVHDKLRAKGGVSCPPHPNKEGWEALSAVISRDDRNVPAYERTSCVHFAHPVPRRYGLNVGLEGKLEDASTVRLMALCSSKIKFSGK
ncbi:MAG: hypothetical protein Q9175_003970 [Cornicularia normoerica]